MSKDITVLALCVIIMGVITSPSQAFVKHYVSSLRNTRLTSFSALAGAKQPIPAVSVIVRKNYVSNPMSPSYLLVQRGKVRQKTVWTAAK